MRVAPLAIEALGEATELLADALPYDQLRVVATEKLFGGNGTRAGRVLGAWEGARLCGVIATAGRYIKILAVRADARRRGVGSALLEAVRTPDAKLRIFDHPGNYLSPGLDVRYTDGRRFLEARGFRALAEVENLRAPGLDGQNSRVSVSRAEALAACAREAGYRIGRVADGGGEREALERFVAATFAPVWAYEVARALDGPRRAVHVAWQGGEPVAFAAADGNNQGLGWFGPAGTALSHRGRGLGEALLIPCLLDVRGLPDAGVIAWIGPKPFYARACGAVDDRRFVGYETG